MAKRGTEVVVLVAVLLALVLSMFGDAAALPEVGRERCERMVGQLVRLAGLEASEDPRGRLSVRVNQEGGPRWIGEATKAAVERHEALVLDGDGLGIVRVEVVADQTHLALRGGLHRQGWNLRPEHPLRVRVVPWIPVLALAVGLLGMRVSGRMGVGFAVAGAVAETIEYVVGWPELFVTVPWFAEIRDGPLGIGVIELARALPEAGVAVGAGVVTLCLVLVAFDHRRSSGKGGALLASGMAGVGGGALWVEAAARCGIIGWIGTAAGAASILAMALAWGQLGRTLPRA